MFTICLIYDLYIKINGDASDGNGNDVEIDPLVCKLRITIFSTRISFVTL
jgi:hypothetical protein